MGGVSFPMLKVYKYTVTVENIVTVNIYTGNKAQVQHPLIKRPISLPSRDPTMYNLETLRKIIPEIINPLG